MAYAEANLRKGNRFESLKAYQKVINLKPDEPEVRVALARIYKSMKNYKDAYSEIIRILKMAPKNIEVHLLLKEINRKNSIPDNLKEDLEPHLTFTSSPKKIKILQKLHLIEKRKYNRLIEDYDKQLEQDEGNPIILYNRTKAVEKVKIAEEILNDLETMVGEEEEEVIPEMELVTPVEESEVIEIPEEEVEEAKAEIESQALIEEQNKDEVSQVDEREDEEKSEQDLLVEVIETQEEEIEEPSTQESEGSDLLLEELETKDEGSKEEKNIEEPVSRVSEERLDFYSNLKGKMDKAFSTISRSRGIVASFIMDDAGILVDSLVSEKINLEELVKKVNYGMKFLLSFNNSAPEERKLFYWVLEFQKGLMVLYPLKPDIYLIVIGKRGASFGAVRFSIERNAKKFKGFFDEMPD